MAIRSTAAAVMTKVINNRRCSDNPKWSTALINISFCGDLCARFVFYVLFFKFKRFFAQVSKRPVEDDCARKSQSVLSEKLTASERVKRACVAKKCADRSGRTR